MEQRQFSSQEVIRLLSQLNELRGEYPPDLLDARRRFYLGQSAQLIAARIETDGRKKDQMLFSVEREPISVIVKALIAVFVALLVAFVIHSTTTGNVDFGWLRELLTR
jgi:hypothetical protein